MVTDLSDKSIDFASSDVSLDSQLCVQLYQASNKMARLYGTMLSPHGITFPQYQALLVLWDRGPSTVGTLCRALDLDTSTLTPVLKRLQASGYVDRFRDRLDERRVHAVLTEKGQAFKADAIALRCKLAGHLGITMAEFVELQRLLQKVSRSIDHIVASAVIAH